MKKISPFLIAGLMIALSGCVDDNAVTTDYCLDDENKVNPGICGCGTPDVDTDGDGTLDCLEECFEDPNKTEPGTCGCGIADDDLDGNKVPDCLEGDMDLCPEDPDKTLPGICGCGIADNDTDGDGAYDCHDECTDDPAKTKAGVCGCGVLDADSDGDQVLDCEDGCPLDGNKLEAGACGCGVPDVDSDEDGVLDCQDACPQDPDKTETGICGCGIADLGQNITDDDGDGTMNCVDLCPNNPIKTEPGKNGCKADDSDGDGYEDDDDICPHNPNITTKGDCNYNADGVFEIWSTSDFERLQAELEANSIPASRLGFTCDDDKKHCEKAGESKSYSTCVWKSSEIPMNFYVENTCKADTICDVTEGGDMGCVAPDRPEEPACTELADPPVAGNCCDASWVDVCSNDKTMQCTGDRLTETTCEYGCSEEGTSCALCRTTETPTVAGDCCDENWMPVCSNNALLTCDGIKLIEEKCDYGCSEEGTCLSCYATETPSKVGDCCNSENFIDHCDGSGILACIRGRVERQECFNTCYETVNDGIQTAACKATHYEDVPYFKVRLMRDIDISETIACQFISKTFAGNWNQIDLYRVDFDGQNHAITFQDNKYGEAIECAITRPLFDNVIESNIYDLQLKFDLRGAASGAFAHHISHSHLKNVTWTGSIISDASLFGEINAMGTGLIANYAHQSYFENIGMSGNVEVSKGKYYGLISTMDNIRIDGVKVDLKDIQLNFDSSSPYFAGAFGKVGSNSQVYDVDVDIAQIQLPVLPRYGYHYIAGVFYNTATHSESSPVVIEKVNVDIQAVKLPSTSEKMNDYYDMNQYFSGVGHSSSARVADVVVNLNQIDAEDDSSISTDKDSFFSSYYENYYYLYFSLGFYSTSASSVIENFTSSVKNIHTSSALADWLKSIPEDEFMYYKDMYCNPHYISNYIYLYGLSQSKNGKADNINVTFEDIKTNSFYDNCNYCGCTNVGTNFVTYGISSSHNGTTSDVDVDMSQIDTNNVVYGMSYSLSGTTNNVDIDMSEIDTGSSIYGLASSIGSSSTVNHARIQGDKIKGSSIYFIAGTLSSGSASSTTNNLALQDVTTYFTNAHANYQAYAIDRINYYRQIKNIATYADVYVKKQSSASSESAFVRYLYNYYNNASYPIKLQNVASSIHYRRYDSYTDNDGVISYTFTNDGATKPLMISSYYNSSSSSSYFSFNHVYWLKRNSTDIGSPYYDSYFTGFDSSNSNSYVATLNGAGTGVTWTTRAVTEDGSTLNIPWIKD